MQLTMKQVSYAVLEMDMEISFLSYIPLFVLAMELY
jgi:hypothetical protein